jgi:hypothetical protein
MVHNSATAVCGTPFPLNEIRLTMGGITSALPSGEYQPCCVALRALLSVCNQSPCVAATEARLIQ